MGKFSVLVDLDRLKDLNSGLGQVALHYGMHLSGIEDADVRFTFLVPRSFVGFFGDKVGYEVVSWRRRYFPWTCEKYDLWHAIHQDSSYFPGNKGCPYILTIHDLNFLGEKTAAKAARRLKRLQGKISRATCLTVISQYTGKEVREHLTVGSKAVKVIYNGVEVKTYEGVVRPDYVPPGAFLFALGVIKEKKNFGVLVDFMQQMPGYNLIIAGNKSNSSYAADMQKRIESLGLQRRVIMPGAVSEEDKYWMYKHCEAVLFPSKLEGMGLPPIEAMRMGKPVFASTRSSIPEICGDLAYYWEHFAPGYMRDVFEEKMKEFARDSRSCENLRAYSMKYRWEENVRAYVSLYKDILSEQYGSTFA